MNALELHQILVDARALIATPETWAQGWYTKNRDGVLCYCAAGAIYQATGALEPGGEHESTFKAFSHRASLRAILAVSFVCEGIPKGQDVNLSHFNDTHTHAEVLALIDSAIQRTERKV